VLQEASLLNEVLSLKINRRRYWRGVCNLFPARSSAGHSFRDRGLFEHGKKNCYPSPIIAKNCASHRTFVMSTILGRVLN